jgi:hypothetical protein
VALGSLDITIIQKTAVAQSLKKTIQKGHAVKIGKSKLHAWNLDIAAAIRPGIAKIE